MRCAGERGGGVTDLRVVLDGLRDEGGDLNLAVGGHCGRIYGLAMADACWIVDSVDRDVTGRLFHAVELNWDGLVLCGMRWVQGDHQFIDVREPGTARGASAGWLHRVWKRAKFGGRTRPSPRNDPSDVWVA